MGCSLKDFRIGTWATRKVGALTVETAEASTENGLQGIVYKVDGKFQGFVGSLDGVLWHVAQLAYGVSLQQTAPRTQLTDREITVRRDGAVIGHLQVGRRCFTPVIELDGGEAFLFGRAVSTLEAAVAQLLGMGQTA
jgi:hypothetical protein